MCQREEQEKSIREDKRRLEKAKKRLADIDKLITHIYEDMVLGNLSQERYQKMLEGYEDEQAALNNEVVGLEDWVASREEIEEWLAIKRIRVTRRCLWVSNKGQIKGQKGRKKHRKSLQSLMLTVIRKYRS